MTPKAVLMSIKPKYAEMIFNGTKTVELRRVCPKVQEGDLVLVYVSGPKMALAGAFHVKGIVSSTPEALCTDCLPASGVSRETFFSYFAGSVRAHGIWIGEAWRLETETDLQSLRKRKGGFHPPQSYRYLRQGELSTFIR